MGFALNNSVETSYLEINTERCPNPYALTTVAFGDKPGGAIATLYVRQRKCVRSTQRLPNSENDAYADDLLASVDSHEVAKIIMNDIDHVLRKGGFQIKEWVMSDGNNCVNSYLINLEIDTEKILALNWGPKSDLFFFVVHMIFFFFFKRIKSCILHLILQKTSLKINYQRN